MNTDNLMVICVTICFILTIDGSDNTDLLDALIQYVKGK